MFLRLSLSLALKKFFWVIKERSLCKTSKNRKELKHYISHLKDHIFLMSKCFVYLEYLPQKTWNMSCLGPKRKVRHDRIQSKRSYIGAFHVLLSSQGCNNIVLTAGTLYFFTGFDIEL